MPFAVVLFIGFFLATAQAAPETVSTEKAARVSSMTEAPVGAAELANITLALFFVLALIFILAWFFRRYGNIASLNKSQIEVLGGVSLGHRERAVLLEVEGEKILVGVAPGHVSRLHVFEKKDGAGTPDDLLPDDSHETAPVRRQVSSGFSEKLKQVLNPGKGGDS